MRIALAVCFLTLAFAAPARAELVQQADNGFVIQHSVTVATDPDATFVMLRTPAKWWDKEHSWTGNAENLYMDSQAGGCFCELIPNAATTESGAPQRTLRGSVQHMQILYTDPGRLLRLSGALGPLQGEAVIGTLTFTMKPVDGGTRITLDYVVGGYMRMKTADIAPAVDQVMSAQLSRLAMALGPLVGPGKAGVPAAGRQASEGDEGTAGGNAMQSVLSSSSMSALVTDLAPDEDVTGSASAPAKPVARPDPKPVAADPGAPKRYKPGTRPLSRPVRSEDDEHSGR